MIFLSIKSYSQQLKSFNGDFENGMMQNGNAVYSYYEDPNTHEYLKQGAFHYSFNGKGDYIGYDQSINGNFNKGLKDGAWTYSIAMVDFGTNNLYFTGSVSLIANYKNGYANGNWKEVRSYKTRKKFYSNGHYVWGQFEPLKTMVINMNFKEGKLIGAVNIDDEFSSFKATGNYDANSLCIGTWSINDRGFGKNRELIYKDNILYEFIARGNNGEVLEGSSKYQIDYDDFIKAKAMNEKEREEAGIIIDTVCGGDLCAATNNIKDYFPKLFSVDYFLYKQIGGDLSFNEGFKGGCNLQVSTTNFTALSSNQDFKKAEEFYNKNDLLRAYEIYSKIDVTKVKPSERKNVTDKIALLKPMIGNLLELYHSNSKFFQEYTKAQYDSLEQDKYYFANKIALKTTKDNYGWTLFNDENSILRKLYDDAGGIKYNFEKPWENKTWDFTKTCFERNKGVYTPIQICVTEQFFKFNTILENEEYSIKQSVYNFYFENTNNSFYTYDKNTFLNNIALGKKEYNLAKSLIDLQSKCNDKKNQIEALNNQNKKKTLFSKFQVVYKDFNTSLQITTELQSLADNLSNLNDFLDKIIALYPQETKDLERQLKSAETADQVKSLIK